MSKDVNGLSDPYFKLKLKTQKWTSKVIYKTLNPVYNEAMEFIVSPSDLLTSGVVIKVECWDKDIVGKEFMGEVDIPLRDIVKRSLSSAGTWIYERAELNGVESGAVHIKFRFQPVDISLRENTTKLLAGYVKKKTNTIDRPTIDPEANQTSFFTRLGRRGPKGTKLKIKKTSAVDASSSDEDSDEVGEVGSGVVNLSDEEYFDFGTDDDEEEEEEQGADGRRSVDGGGGGGGSGGTTPTMRSPGKSRKMGSGGGGGGGGNTPTMTGMPVKSIMKLKKSDGGAGAGTGASSNTSDGKGGAPSMKKKESGSKTTVSKKIKETTFTSQLSGAV